MVHCTVCSLIVKREDEKVIVFLCALCSLFFVDFVAVAAIRSTYTRTYRALVKCQLEEYRTMQVQYECNWKVCEYASSGCS